MYQQFETDSKKENDGVVIKFNANGDGTIPEMTIARQGGSNKLYEAELARVSAPYVEQIRFKALKPETYTRLYVEAFSVGVIKGWKNIKARDGSDLPYTKENAIQLLTDLPELFEVLQKHASNTDNYRREALEAQAKN